LPYVFGGTLFVLVSMGAVIWALRLFGVRDWRCHALALVSWPAIFGFWLGALSPLLLLGVAAVWRWRARVWAPAVALAALVIAKLFPWPLGVWMVITGRWRTLGSATALALFALAGAWAVIGFAGVTVYPHMLSELSSLEDRFGASIVAQLLALGVRSSLATAIALAVGGVLLVTAWRVAQRDHDETRAFGLVVLAALISSPLVWTHYFILVFAPIALTAPRLSPLWFLPVVWDIAPEPDVLRQPWALLPYLAVLSILIYRLVAPSVTRFRSAAETTAEAWTVETLPSRVSYRKVPVEAGMRA
jgi:hypothetical protein